MAVQLVSKFAHFNIKRCSAGFVANQSKCYSTEEKTVTETVALRKPESEEQVDKIMVNAKESIIPVTGMPVEHTQGRLIRIYKRPKNSMQSGTGNTHSWEMEFEERQRWENPLMGWCSTGDPVSNIKVQFASKEDATRFAEKNGYEYYVEYERKDKPKVKSYGFNFSWNKRTRVSTK